MTKSSFNKQSNIQCLDQIYTFIKASKVTKQIHDSKIIPTSIIIVKMANQSK